MRRKVGELNRDVERKVLDTLFSTAETAVRKQTITSFLREILTESEQLMLGRRLVVAHMLLSGRSQAEIIYELKLSPNTVWRINKWLTHQFPEYGEALKSIEKERASKDKKRKKGRSYGDNDLFSLESLKKKYPLHFLLFNIADEIFRPE